MHGNAGDMFDWLEVAGTYSRCARPTAPAPGLAPVIEAAILSASCDLQLVASRRGRTRRARAGAAAVLAERRVAFILVGGDGLARVVEQAIVRQECGGEAAGRAAHRRLPSCVHPPVHRSSGRARNATQLGAKV